MSEVFHDVEVLWLAKNHYFPDAALHEHFHKEYYQIYYVTHGRGTFIVNGETHDLEENMFVMAAPGVSHGIEKLYSDLEPALTILEAKFVVLRRELDTDLHKLPSICNSTERMKSILTEMFQEGIQKDECYEETVVCLLSHFLYLTIRLHRNFGLDISDKTLQPKTTTIIKEYLHQHYAEDISLDVLAELTGYTKNYLCRIFHDNTGITINSYLNTVRVNNAAQLLVTTDLDLTEIGRLTGYNSVFHFIKTFKKLVGIPPGNYRKSELVGIDLVVGKVEGLNAVIRTGDVVSTLLDKK